MECLDCGYDLAGVPAGLCPECGRKFDPRDRATYGPVLSPRLPRRWLYWACPIGAAIPVLLHAWLHLMMLVARFELGHWPRSNAADAKGIPLVDLMDVVAVLGVLATPIAVPAGIAGLLFLGWYEPRRAGVLAGIVAAGWAALWLIGDPARVWHWFMD